jgi:Na+/H+ antiporter NhaD/arsenite permease-like protein
MILILCFAIGYLCIALEHVIKIDKAASALLTGTVLWLLLSTPFTGDSAELINESLMHHLGEISSILFFLLAAMTIVELIDTHQGFEIITQKINSTNPIKLLWVIGTITFLLSSILDNLTTVIVIGTLLRKLINDKQLLFYFGGMAIIAANTGGAFSPIGDVTTIMLWVSEKISAMEVIKMVILPSLVCFVLPLLMFSWTFYRKKITLPKPEVHAAGNISRHEQILVLVTGVLALITVPLIKTFTHLPPVVAILLTLGIMWGLTELLHARKDEEFKNPLKVSNILKKIDSSSILFFLGILLAVAALQYAGSLTAMATWMDENIGNMYAINTLIGVVSAIVDNVPLVAASIGMYGSDVFPLDHDFWLFLSYTAGTGGSILIIGSAAGVAIMGILKIDFFWYLRHISLPAIVGYAGGVLVYYFFLGDV